MANPERGEVDLVVGESVYTLALTMNGICELQTRTGKTYGQLLNAIVPPNLDWVAFREVLFQSLKRHHAKDFPNLTSVGEFVEMLPEGYGSAQEALGRLITLNAERSMRASKNGHADPQPAQT